MKPKFIISFCFVASTALTVEILSLLIIFSYDLTSIWILISHIIVVSGITAWCFNNKSQDKEINMTMLLIITSSILGPFGTFGSMITLILYAIYTRSATPFDKWYKSIFPEEEIKETEKLFNIIETKQKVLNQEGRITPFTDIISFGSLHQKRDALLMISKNFHSHFAPALSLALKDNNNSIRVQAASTITKIENKFLENSIKIERSLNKNPNSPKIQLNTAKHYDAYTYSGLLDIDREKENRKMAISAYYNYLKLLNTNQGFIDLTEEENARVALCRLLMQEGSFKKAVNILEETLKKGFTSTNIILWYLESLYKLNRFNDLRKFSKNYCQNLFNDTVYPVSVQEAVKLWTNSNDKKFLPEVTDTKTTAVSGEIKEELNLFTKHE